MLLLSNYITLLNNIFIILDDILTETNNEIQWLQTHHYNLFFDVVLMYVETL